MENQINPLIIGVDVSKDKIDVRILPLKKSYQVENTIAEIRKFLRELKEENAIELVVFESTGGYEQGLRQALKEEEIAAHAVHPNRAYHFAKSRGFFAKTDKIDAQILAAYGSQEGVKANGVFDEQATELRQLSSRKRQLKAQSAAEKNRLSQPYLSKAVRSSIQRTIKWLEKERERVEKEIAEQINQNEGMQKRIVQLRSFKGVGKEIAQTLAIDLPELGQVKRTEIACLVGVAPRNRDSGKKTGKRYIQGGRSHIRQLCYMAALVAMRHNPPMKVLYDRLISKGKPAKVALIAVARKILVILNAMLRQEAVWQGT